MFALLNRICFAGNPDSCIFDGDPGAIFCAPYSYTGTNCPGTQNPLSIWKKNGRFTPKQATRARPP